jgi:hypothetical protein
MRYDNVEVESRPPDAADTDSVPGSFGHSKADIINLEIAGPANNQPIAVQIATERVCPSFHQL